MRNQVNMCFFRPLVLLGRLISYHAGSLTRRLRTVFYIALSNFIFPC
jgi:hypothetical protein